MRASSVARWSLIGVVAMLLALVGATATAQEDGANGAAGIVIHPGDGEPVYVVVTYDGDSIGALDLLHEADVDAVTVEFGGLGQAVCKIVDTGCDVSACRQRVCQTGDPESPFWQYWEQDDEGRWAFSPLGASHVTMEHGDIGAWVWTGTEADLDAMPWDSLATRAGAPDAVVTGEISGEPSVYRSGFSSDDEDGENDQAGSLAAAGVIALVGLAGGWLIIRQRRRGLTDA